MWNFDIKRVAVCLFIGIALGLSVDLYLNPYVEEPVVSKEMNCFYFSPNMDECLKK